VRRIVIVFLLVVAGCGNDADPLDDGSTAPTPSATSETLDTAGLERELKTQIESQTGGTIRSVECPADVELEEGGTFECTAEESNADHTIVVTQVDDQGNLEWEVTGSTD
jgi:hypothetical protein